MTKTKYKNRFLTPFPSLFAFLRSINSCHFRRSSVSNSPSFHSCWSFSSKLDYCLMSRDLQKKWREFLQTNEERIEPVRLLKDVVPSTSTQSRNSTGKAHGSVRKSVTNISKSFARMCDESPWKIFALRNGFCLIVAFWAFRFLLCRLFIRTNSSSLHRSE